jgi:transcription antitermination factor NusG
VGTPVLLPDLFIESIRAHERALHTGRIFHRGDRVVVRSGPFKWVEGLFDRFVSANGRVRILLDLVHGSVAVQMEAAELELAG